jgi:dTDP-4-amino-4,6-dideoxygalactose transaminase
MSAPEFSIPLMRPKLPSAAALWPYFEEIDDNRWYTNQGPIERRLQARVASHFGLPEGGVACVANGTTGLILALATAAGGRAGYCVMPSFTFVATAHAALAAGLTPVFADVDRETWCLTPETVDSAVRAVDGPVRAVVPVSPFGAPLDPAPWDAYETRTGIPAVLDAAAAFDTVRPGNALAVVSLHATKVLSAGEGGLVLARDPARIAEVAARGNFGFSQVRQANLIGLNGKMSEYAAAVTMASLDAWPGRKPAVERVAAAYRRYIKPVDGVRLFPGFGNGWVSSTCNVVFDQPVADNAIAMLDALGIECRRWWNAGCHREPAFAGYPRPPLPVTEWLTDRVVGVPFYSDLGMGDIGRVCAALQSVARISCPPPRRLTLDRTG